MSATQTKKTKKSQAHAFDMGAALAQAGITSKPAKCSIIHQDAEDVRALAGASEVAGAQATPSELISLGNYVLADGRTTLCMIAGEYDFDQSVVRALVQMRKDAHEGVKPERTEDKVEHATLASEEIDALRKDRREKSKAKRAETRAGKGLLPQHGGLGHALAWVFTFGNFGR